MRSATSQVTAQALARSLDRTGEGFLVAGKRHRNRDRLATFALRDQSLEYMMVATH